MYVLCDVVGDARRLVVDMVTKNRERAVNEARRATSEMPRQVVVYADGPEPELGYRLDPARYTGDLERVYGEINLPRHTPRSYQLEDGWSTMTGLAQELSVSPEWLRNCAVNGYVIDDFWRVERRRARPGEGKAQTQYVYRAIPPRTWMTAADLAKRMGWDRSKINTAWHHGYRAGGIYQVERRERTSADDVSSRITYLYRLSR